MDDVFERMRSVISKQLEIDESKITLESSFRQDLDADSLDTYELVNEFETTFGVSFPEDKAAEFETVKDVVDYVQSQSK